MAVNPISDAVFKITQKLFDEHDAFYKALEAGLRVCCHDMRFELDTKTDPDHWRMVYRFDSHVLVGDEKCLEVVEKTEYVKE